MRLEDAMSTGAVRRSGILQQKTGNLLTLPLAVGRLAGYVLDEWPGSADDHVFLRSVAPCHVPQGRSDRCEGRDPVPTPQRRVQAAAVLGRAREGLTNLYMSFDRQRHPGGSAEPDHLGQRLGLLGVIPDWVEQQVGGT